MPTAYLSPSLLQDLTNVSVSPGAGNTGYPLVWNNTSGRFELAVLGVAGGGTGTSNGSITGTGALTFTAGGTDQDINLNTSGTGIVSIAADDFKITQRSNTNTVLKGVSLFKDNNFFQAINGSGDPNTFWPIFYGKSNLTDFPSLAFLSSQTPGTDYFYGSIWFRLLNGFGNGAINPSHKGFVFSNNVQSLLTIMGGGDSTFHSTTESTSTTTGAVRIDGGLGVAKNINIGGNLRFAGGTVPATATSAGTTGDIRYDGSHLYICTATNTWVRTALSTW